MTTLTPEKEAELRGLLEKARPWAESPYHINIPRRHDPKHRDVGVVLHEDIAGLSDGLFMVEAAQKCILALPDLLSALSTEREGRERAEAERDVALGQFRYAAKNDEEKFTRIATLQALIAEKDEALRPLKYMADHHDETDRRYKIKRDDGREVYIPLALLRRARTALNSTEAKTGEPG